jgi:hypothetical protein
MLKKVFFTALIAAFAFSGCKKKPGTTYVKRQRPPIVEQVSPTLPPADQLGEKTTFELTYRGITGKEDDIDAMGGWGFGSDNLDSPFVKAVKKNAENDIFVSHNPFLHDRQYTPIEYKDKEVLHAYFDLNADGELSDEERFSPVEVSERSRRGDDTTVFMTPDFTVTNEQGQKTPFRILLWVAFHGDSKEPNVTWSPMGVYEGVADLNGQPMKLYLFPDFSSQCYAKYARSRYGLVPTSQGKSDYVPQATFSSLVVHDKRFYRMTLDEVNPSNQSIKISFIQDKTPCGKIALKVNGKEEFKYSLNHANLNGAEDGTVHFNIQKGMDQLPVGDYTISYGSFAYGKEKPEGYSTSFQNVPAFAITKDRITTIELGKPEIKIQAVEENKRYHGDKTYKTEFSEGTAVYIDAAFVGIAKETYRGFDLQVQKENYTAHESIKARILITDSKGSEVVAKELEYG